MQMQRGIAVKVFLTFVAAAVLAMYALPALPQPSADGAGWPLRIVYAAEDGAGKSASKEQTTAPGGQDSAGQQAGALRAAALGEINTYISQMDNKDLAATLKLFRTMQLLKTVYVEDVSSDTLLSGAIKGTVNALGDQHSVYLDPKLYQELSISTHGTYSGVGIMLGMRDKTLTVIAPIEGTVADQAGILSGDLVLRIDGQDTKDMALDEAVNMIRGPAGSQVVLTIGRTGQEPREYTLVRADIQLKSVSGRMLENEIGYIRITMFNEHTGDEFAKKLQELDEQDMKALVLDLRNNPGGLIGASAQVAEKLVPRGPIVSVVRKDGSKDTLYSQLDTANRKLVVLVNNGSASASEIVAGAIQDTGAGTLIGTRTFGKGSVQSVFRLDKDSGVKITTAKYFTPNNRSIDGRGIDPDIVIAPPASGEDSRDLQLEKALEVLKEKL